MDQLHGGPAVRRSPFGPKAAHCGGCVEKQLFLERGRDVGVRREVDRERVTIPPFIPDHPEMAAVDPTIGKLGGAEKKRLATVNVATANDLEAHGLPASATALLCPEEAEVAGERQRGRPLATSRPQRKLSHAPPSEHMMRQTVSGVGSAEVG